MKKTLDETATKMNNLAQEWQKQGFKISADSLNKQLSLFEIEMDERDGDSFGQIEQKDNGFDYSFDEYVEMNDLSSF